MMSLLVLPREAHLRQRTVGEAVWAMVDKEALAMLSLSPPWPPLEMKTPAYFQHTS